MDKHEYFKHPALSNSRLGDFKQSPAHYKYRLDNPSKDTKATLTGSAFHYLCFEPGMISKYMMVLREEERPEPKKDYRNTDNKKWKDDQINLALSKGLELISSDEFGIAEDMYDAVTKDPQAFELLRAQGNKFETVGLWEREGIEFKRKTDIHNPDFIADLKSTENADPFAFEKSLFSWEYDRQGGMYADGERVMTDSQFFNPFYIIAVEKSPPFGVSVHELTHDVLTYGAAEYMDLARKLKECEKKNEWPGYSYKYLGGYNQINLPKWKQ